MDTQGRSESERRIECKGQGIVQNEVWQEGQSKSTRKRRSNTPEKLRRKGSFLVRMGSAKGPLKDEKGRPTRLKLSLVAWGHSGDKASAVAKGRRLLARYQAAKKRKKK